MLRTATWLLSLALAVPALAAPALAADEQKWDFYGDSVDQRLFYGSPKCDRPVSARVELNESVGGGSHD
jgi:hypothetical protein